MKNSPSLRLAIDIGGTFTDTVLMDDGGGLLASAKTPTTPSNPTLGALAGARIVVAQAGVQWEQIAGFIHGTTLATNALIERRGARVSTITNDGFRDILEIAYERRYSQYDINITKPDLIVPRSRSFTIGGRMSASGQELTILDDAAIAGLVESLERERTEAIAICLLHAYANPSHELALRDALASALPGVTISLSHEVSPEAREFDRLCTTLANAYIQPLMSEYLTDFEAAFSAEGLTCPVLMMTAGGGMTTLETAARLPIRLVESGPAGGAILAARVAKGIGEDAVLSFDMGGTTAKLCLIDNYTPQTARTFEVSRAERFIKGSGMPVRIPVVDMIEIGAGGGSKARVDRLGRVMVGPESAGSEPGPAGFGKGGTDPMVTDADIAQGYIDPDAFAEGRLQIDFAACERALVSGIAVPLALKPSPAAQAVSDIVDESMASAARMHAVESGKDLAQRTMIAFGGNGPLHACRVARRSGVRRIVVPPDPGVGSAVGFLFAPVSFEIVQSRYTTLDNFDKKAINAFLSDLIVEAKSIVRQGAPDGALTLRIQAFMRYQGQGHEIEIDVPSDALSDKDVSDLRRAFESEYARLFSRAVPGMTIEILNWAVQVSSAAGDAPDAKARPDHVVATPNRKRDIFCDVTAGWTQADVYTRSDLLPGTTLNGPALIVEPQTTTFVGADFSAAVDGLGNLVLTKTIGEPA